MSNFSRELENLSDVELKTMLNQTSPGYASLVSDELTRRSLGHLQTTIEQSNTQARNLEVANYRLQWIMVILAFITTVVALYPVVGFSITWVAPILTKLLSIPVLSTAFLQMLSAIISAFAALTIGFYTRERINKESERIKAIHQQLQTETNKKK